MITLEAIPAFTDNYLWLLVRGSHAAIVDPGDAAPVLDALQRKNIQLDTILITHHHPDHIGGIDALLAARKVPVYGPRAELARIPQIDHPLDDGDRVELPFLGIGVDVFAVPGHTLGHIAYYAAAEKSGLLLCGDTLFASGCGRLFEGSPAQMHNSLQRLAALPPETRVYCTHEYTLSNLAFARAVEPDSRSLADEVARVQALRAQGVPSVPSTIARELRFNPFLRGHVAEVRAAAERHAGHRLAETVDVFASLRAWKDGFRAPTP